MKRLLFVFLFVFAFGISYQFDECQMAYAEPFLSSAPQAGVDVHKVNWDATLWEDPVPANVDGSAYIDLESLTSGVYSNANIQAGSEWKLNGEGQGIYEWSASVPFSLLKPVAPLNVTDLDLINAGM